MCKQRLHPYRGLLLIVLILVTGCQPKSNEIDGNNSASATVEGSKTSKVNIPPKEEKVKLSNEITAADRISNYTNLREVAAASDKIVFGEIIGIEYEIDPTGMLYTIATIRVEEVLAGDAQIGEEISFRYGGGYALGKDYLTVCEGSSETKMIENLRKWSEEELATAYVYQHMEGEKDAVLGDRSIYCFKKDDKGDFPETYIRTDYRESEFVQVKDGRFLLLNMPRSADEIRAFIDGEKQPAEGALWTKEEVLEKLGLQ